MPLKYWDFAFKYTTLVINNLPTKVLQNKTPHEVLYHHPSNYDLFRVFGRTCFPLLCPYNKHKFDFKSHACLFLGYSVNKNGYFCLHPNGKLYTFKDVTFNEKEFPYKCTQNMFDPHTPSSESGVNPTSTKMLLLPTISHQTCTSDPPATFVSRMPPPSPSSNTSSTSKHTTSLTQNSTQSLASLHHDTS